MKNKIVYTGLFLLFLCVYAQGQTLKGVIKSVATQKPIANVEIYESNSSQLVKTNAKGQFTLSNIPNSYSLVIASMAYQTKNIEGKISDNQFVEVFLEDYQQELNEVIISQKREEAFALKRLQPVVGTAIYAGKKSEVVLLDQMVGNLASNNARQIYSQVVGLNIYENNDGGVQLNVGGRGLDPNRTANFNTRQNGYDISADVLGYPESYYTPPAEALSQIQVIRGAASLQYGTQFGGLINFILKKPSPKKISFKTRNSIGSFGLFNSFNSLSGTLNKFNYYTYFQYKKTNGFRPNSRLESYNAFAHLGYQFSEKTKISLETTYLTYVAQQAGGLTDSQFEKDITKSFRTRNWFKVNWLLMAMNFEHKISPKSDIKLSVFGLNASRYALGFRGNPYQLNQKIVEEDDEQNTDGTFFYPRDLIKGEFRNWGAEFRYITRYKIAEKDAVFLIGSKYYQAKNRSEQGAGSKGIDPDFTLREEITDYPFQSSFVFPNRNLAFFSENVFFITDKISITPGVRFEYIHTQSEGTYQENEYNLANKLKNSTKKSDNQNLSRSFLLYGLGLSYEPADNFEFYTNISKNYRSVTYSDIRIVNSSSVVDPNIQDENGYTFDLGIRGKWNKKLSYDIGAFSMLYNDRIGLVFDDRARRVRKNIGDAITYGIESFVDWNLASTLNMDIDKYRLSWFVNSAFTGSQYLRSEENNIEGKNVEFIPAVNIKTGLSFGIKNLLGNVQFTYISEQFTDAENSQKAGANTNNEGIVGEIPAYSIVDFSLSYKISKHWKLEGGVNNLLNEKYFTRRASGYPGPGIIPSEPRSFYLTVGLGF